MKGTESGHTLCSVHKAATVTGSIMKFQVILESFNLNRQVGEDFPKEMILMVGLGRKVVENKFKNMYKT